MQRSLGEMRGYTVEATDGDIGKVAEFLFDDRTWRIRYMCVNVGNWLSRKEVLISPAAVKEPRELSIHLNIPRERVEKSPLVDTDSPVSREKERELHSYYGWPLYWGGTLENNMTPYPAPGVEELARHNLEDEEKNKKDNHLRSTKEVSEYSIQAKDGNIGHAEDFIVSTDIWRIQYIVVDTKKLVPGKKVILPPEWVTGISWEEDSIFTEVTKKEVENSPEFDPAKPVNRETEEVLYDYYGRPKYWVKDL